MFGSSNTTRTNLSKRHSLRYKEINRGSLKKRQNTRSATNVTFSYNLEKLFHPFHENTRQKWKIFVEKRRKLNRPTRQPTNSAAVGTDTFKKLQMKDHSSCCKNYPERIQSKSSFSDFSNGDNSMRLMFSLDDSMKKSPSISLLTSVKLVEFFICCIFYPANHMSQRAETPKSLGFWDTADWIKNYCAFQMLSSELKLPPFLSFSS